MLKKVVFAGAGVFSVIGLAGCTVSVNPTTLTASDTSVCVAVAARKLDCPNEPYSVNRTQPHHEAHQQMLPMEQRDEILRSEVETLNRNH